MDKHVPKEFFKEGYVFQSRLFPSERGSPQGGVVSPTLANMVLNGLKRLVRSNFKGTKLVRFADDFIVTLHSLEEAEDEKHKHSEVLEERGLKLSDEKTLTTHMDGDLTFSDGTSRSIETITDGFSSSDHRTNPFRPS